MLSSAALGSFVLWLRLRYGPNIQSGFENFFDDFLNDFCFRVFAKLMFFVSVGSVLSVIIVEPATMKQALIAGMAWTTLLGGVATAPKKRGKRSA
jgi:hypothetical protein